MKKIIALVILLGAVCLVPSFKVRASSDNDYLVGRAIVLANFKPDEMEQMPVMKYIMPGQKGTSSSVFDSNTRVVNLIDPNFGFGGVQAIFTAPEYTIIDAGRSRTVSSFKKTIGGVLDENGYEIAREDQVSPGLEIVANSTVKINITRVEFADLEKTESIPFQTKTVDDPTLERGKTSVSQAGQDGQRKLTYRVRRENGLEVSRDLEKNEIVTKPQDKIVKNGTKVVVLSSVRGIATATNLSNAVVSANYKRGTTIRITNLANGVKIIKTVNYTWGTATAPSGIVLDLSWSILDELKFNGFGAGPNVLVEELKN